jgi:hypothetical protein
MPPAVLAALGGAGAMAGATVVHGRLLIPAHCPDEAPLLALGARGIVPAGAGAQVLFAPDILAAWCRSHA